MNINRKIDHINKLWSETKQGDLTAENKELLKAFELWLDTNKQLIWESAYSTNTKGE